jgi:hypothetical protein
VAEEASPEFPQRSKNARKSGLPLPVADGGSTLFPQPRHWRAVAKQAREWQMRQGGKAKPAAFFGHRKAGKAVRAAPEGFSSLRSESGFSVQFSEPILNTEH